MNVRSVSVSPDRAVITLVDGRVLTITRAWLADRFGRAPGRSPSQKRDTVLAALRATYGDAELLPPERLWVDFEDDGTIRDVVLQRDGGCPFDNERWQHLLEPAETGESVR